MIFGLDTQVFCAFLIWPVVYTLIAVIMYFVMGHNDKKEEAWEKQYDEWQASLGNKSEGGDEV